METTKNPQTLTINQVPQLTFGQPPIYFNGVGVGIAPTDVVITLLNGNRTVGQIQATPPVLKSLIKHLQLGIEQLEKDTSSKFSTLDDLVQMVQKKHSQT